MSAAGAAAELLIIGGGLAAGWLARALQRRGREVVLVSPDEPGIPSFCGYGGVPWWLPDPDPMGGSAVLASAPTLWQELEAEQGPLGWQSCRLRLHWSADQQDQAATLAAQYAQWVAGSELRSLSLELPYARVDGVRLAQAWPRLLECCSSGRIRDRVLALEPCRQGNWQVQLAAGGSITARQVVLAAGAGSLALWPALAASTPPLAFSWSAALLIAGSDLPADRLPPGAAEGIVMPLLLQRPQLEARAGRLERPEWIVDAGLAPHGDGWLLGQLSLVAPDGTGCGEPASSGEPAEPAWLEERLRDRLAMQWPQLADRPGRLLQLPVAFRSGPRPCQGAVAGAPGLWSFSGFSPAFAQVPELANRLAATLAPAVER